jgi:hypothetical protein
VIRILLKGKELPPLADNKKSNNYYIHIQNTLKDSGEAAKLFTQAISILDSAMKTENYKRHAPADLTRLKNFTTQLIQSAM